MTVPNLKAQSKIRRELRYEVCRICGKRHLPPRVYRKALHQLSTKVRRRWCNCSRKETEVSHGF